MLKGLDVVEILSDPQLIEDEDTTSLRNVEDRKFSNVTSRPRRLKSSNVIMLFHRERRKGERGGAVRGTSFIIIIIIIIIILITSMQGIYNYTPETNHVSRVYRVADVLNCTLNVI